MQRCVCSSIGMEVQYGKLGSDRDSICGRTGTGDMTY